MLRALDPFRFLLIAVAGWMNQHQLLVIDYLSVLLLEFVMIHPVF